MANVTISSLEHMIRLLQQHPELLNLSSLAPLQSVIAKAAAASKKCGCHAAGVYKEHRGSFELALNALGNGDHLVVKKKLGVDKISYYIRNAAGGLALKQI